MKKIIYMVLILVSIFSLYLLFGHKQNIYEGLYQGTGYNVGTQTWSQGGKVYTINTTKNKCGNFLQKVKRTDNILDASGNVIDTQDILLNDYVPGAGMLINASALPPTKSNDSGIPGLQWSGYFWGDYSTYISQIEGSCSNPLPPGAIASTDNCGNKVITDVHGNIISTTDSNGYTVTKECTKSAPITVSTGKV